MLTINICGRCSLVVTSHTLSSYSLQHVGNKSCSISRSSCPAPSMINWWPILCDWRSGASFILEESTPLELLTLNTAWTAGTTESLTIRSSGPWTGQWDNRDRRESFDSNLRLPGFQTGMSPDKSQRGWLDDPAPILLIWELSKQGWSLWRQGCWWTSFRGCDLVLAIGYEPNK